MAYNQFTLARVQADFGITLDSVRNLFPDAVPCPLPEPFRRQLHDRVGWATTVNTEAARTQFLVAPLLAEFWERARDRIAMYSGTRFDVDEASGLVGVCDFIIGRPPQFDFVVAPVLAIVEAKNEQIMGGLGQCAAAMIAAQRFNATRNPKIETIYGAVTDGGEWRFLRLHERTLQLDLTDYLIADPERILGILFHIVGLPPTVQAAA